MKKIKRFFIQIFFFIAFYIVMLLIKGIFIPLGIDIEFVLLVSILFNLLGGNEL